LLVKCDNVVGVFVGVDAADDGGCFGCHAGIRSAAIGEIAAGSRIVGRSH
jgi:hypothetical protein